MFLRHRLVPREVIVVQVTEAQCQLLYGFGKLDQCLVLTEDDDHLVEALVTVDHPFHIAALDGDLIVFRNLLQIVDLLFRDRCGRDSGSQ